MTTCRRRAGSRASHEREQVVLVRAAAVVEHEQPLGIASRRALAVRQQPLSATRRRTAPSTGSAKPLSSCARGSESRNAEPTPATVSLLTRISARPPRRRCGRQCARPGRHSRSTPRPSERAARVDRCGRRARRPPRRGPAGARPPPRPPPSACRTREEAVSRLLDHLAAGLGEPLPHALVVAGEHPLPLLLAERLRILVDSTMSVKTNVRRAGRAELLRPSSSSMAPRRSNVARAAPSSPVAPCLVAAVAVGDAEEQARGRPIVRRPIAASPRARGASARRALPVPLGEPDPPCARSTFAANAGARRSPILLRVGDLSSSSAASRAV